MSKSENISFGINCSFDRVEILAGLIPGIQLPNKKQHGIILSRSQILVYRSFADRRTDGH